AARILLDMVENEDAQIVGDKILVQHAAAAALPRALASAIGLPPLAKPSATLSFQGRIDSADGLVRVRWFDPNARPIQAERIGAILRWGDESGMLSKPLFSVLEAIEGFNASAGRPIE